MKRMVVLAVISVIVFAGIAPAQTALKHGNGILPDVMNTGLQLKDLCRLQLRFSHNF